jgi:putative addiction module killer protein
LWIKIIHPLLVLRNLAYRIYFAQVGNSIVVILCGGDKSTQNDDTYKAIEYWKDYRRRENVG